MLVLGNYYGHFRNNGGTITIKDGIFKSNEVTSFFDVEYGKMIIYDGNFEGNGVFIDATGNFSGTEVTIEGGEFKTESAPALRFYSYCSPLKVTLGNCSISSKNSHAISINDIEYGLKEKLGNFTLDGCYIEGDEGAILLNSQRNYSLSGWIANLVNCSLKSLSTDKKLGAIWSDYCNESESIIKTVFSNYNRDIFMTKYYTDMQETTYKELVFKDGNLISAIGNPNDVKDNSENNGENTGNNMENNTENNSESNSNSGDNIKDETIENDTKLPQTGEENNVFANWLSIAIPLGIFWLVSMLLIEREKKKMAKR